MDRQSGPSNNGPNQLVMQLTRKSVEPSFPSVDDDLFLSSSTILAFFNFFFLKEKIRNVPTSIPADEGIRQKESHLKGS